MTSRFNYAQAFALTTLFTVAGCQDSAYLASDSYLEEGCDDGHPAPAAGWPVGSVSAVLERVRYDDANRSHRIDAGDTLTLSFRIPVDSMGAIVDDLALTSPGDSFGNGAYLDTQEEPSRDVVLHLGAAPRLSIFRTYIPNDLPNRSPAAVSIVGPGFHGPDGEATGGPVRITAQTYSILSFLGESYPDDPWSRRSYKGTLHAHTGYSDGADDPAGACAYARDRGGLDFFAVTDHLEYIAYAPGTYSDTHRQLDRHNVPGEFVTIAGYEWGGGPISISPPVWSNHINVLGDPQLMPLSYRLSGFYDLLSERPASVIGQFNHPGIGGKGVMEIDLWDDLAYDAKADRRMRLMRCDRGKHNDTVGYIPCLDRGWHVSPQSSQDNHDRDWGTRNKKRTGVWARALTRPAILQALREMRTFSTSDLDAEIRAVADGRWAMGSTLFGWGPHELEVRVSDAGGDGFESIELVTIGGTIADSYYPEGAPQARWTVTVDPQGDRWYYFRAFQEDGDELYSAPFFLDR